MTQRAIALQLLDQAVEAERINPGERHLVRLWWQESGAYRRVPSMPRQDGWQDREARAEAILETARPGA